MKSRGANNRFHRMSRLVSYGVAVFLLTLPAKVAFSFENVRPCCCAGYQYPTQQSELYSQVEAFLKLYPTESQFSSIQAIIAPQAPYVYIGPILGAAYSNLINKNFDRIIILGYDPTAIVPTLYIGAKIATPLGQLRSDDVLASRLIDESNIKFEIVDAEYPLPGSIEAQLPFLQYLYGERPLLAIGLGGQTSQEAIKLGNSISEIVGDSRTLIIGVSNLSQYYDSGSGEGMDRLLIDRLKGFELEKMGIEFEQGRIQAESPAVLIATLQIAQENEADYIEILRYANSAVLSGDQQSTVGYLTAAIGNKKPSTGEIECFSTDEEKYLLNLARMAIKDVLAIPREPEISQQKPTDNVHPDGIYLTIDYQGKIRGGCSLLFSGQPIDDLISSAAQSAAFNDPRFNPITFEELNDLNITLHMLFNARRINSPSNFDPNKDAIFISKGSYSALVFPGELNLLLKKEEILGRACINAGLLSNCWRQNETSVWSFDIQIVKEER
ncbi:AmmeMemoRadiSam system protein B [bacterium]|nr:AmmeMemoRadiSam system protein B [bacterium]